MDGKKKKGNSQGRGKKKIQSFAPGGLGGASSLQIMVKA